MNQNDTRRRRHDPADDADMKGLRFSHSEEKLKQISVPFVLSTIGLLGEEKKKKGLFRRRKKK